MNALAWMLETVAEIANPQPPVGEIGRGFLLLAFLILGLVVVMSALVLGMLARRRERLRMLSKSAAKARGEEDPWKASAQRADVPTAEELYRASGFDQDDTRIEDSPDFGDDGPGDSGKDHKRRKPRKPDQF